MFSSCLSLLCSGSVCRECHGDLGGVCGASVLSPCGGLVIAGGEGGRVGVWRSDDGKGRREGVCGGMIRGVAHS